MASRKWLSEKKGTGKSYRQNGTQSQTYYTTQESRKNGQYLPTNGTGDGQDGNGGDEGRDDKRKFRNSKYDFEDKKDEESDTEDSCELEITPEQLNQVVPGEVLKIKLPKKKPIKITAGAPNGEPDPAQTKVKTIHDPINRRWTTNIKSKVRCSGWCWAICREENTTGRDKATNVESE